MRHSRAFLRLKFWGWSWLYPALALGFLVVTCSLCLAQEGAALPYANEIRELRERVRYRQREMESVVNDYETYGEFTRSDIPLVRADYQRLIDQCQQAIDAFERGATNEARALARQSERARPDREWHRRLQARYYQQELWPAEDWVMTMELRYGGARARKYAGAWVDARRKASLAWAEVAEAIAPDVPPARVAELEDKAHAAQSEVRAHEFVWSIYETMDGRMPDPRVQSPELTNTVAKFEELRERIVSIQRKRAEVDWRQREWVRDRARVERELEKAYAAAYEAYEAAKRAKQK